MRTIHFKNGKKCSVSQNAVEALKKKILEGCNQYQTFTDNFGECFFIVNLQEIVYID